MVCCINITYITIYIMFIFNSQLLAQEVFITNLDKDCLRCLCFAASNCDTTLGCSRGHCGPFQLGKQYWIDAGRPTLLSDDPNTDFAFKNCAFTFGCAEGTVKHYLSKYGTDCNGDGITNCDDYALINFNGAFECAKSVEGNAAGRLYWQRYKDCGDYSINTGVVKLWSGDGDVQNM